MESLKTADSASSEDPETVTQPLDPDADTKQSAAPAAPAVVKTSAAKSVIAPAPQPAENPTLQPASLPVSAAASSGPLTAAPIMVQIAAVSHQEDANALASALREHGYSVSIRNEPQDKLLHVQLGPFATRDAAKAIRTKLIADGYNAIVKP
jgi:cell division septation protein DedD